MSVPVATRGWIGEALPRAEDQRFLQGQAQFVGDMRLPSMLHAVFVRSIYAHGILRGVDAETTLGLPGVRAVLTGADVAELVDPFLAAPLVQPVQRQRRRRGLMHPLELSGRLRPGLVEVDDRRAGESAVQLT